MLPASPLRFCTATLLLTALTAQAQQFRQGAIADVYLQNCASCHGDRMQGGLAPTMQDEEWLTGGDDASLARAIREGIPERAMPAWGDHFTEEEIRAMVIYIREQRLKFKYDQLDLPAPAEQMELKSQLHDFHLATWGGELNEPWSLAFLPGDRAIVTEKEGRAYLITGGQRATEPLTGLPATIFNGGQGGLYDVVPHPNYAENGWLYFAYADLLPGNLSMTRVSRARLKENALVDWQDIFQAKPEHYLTGSRAHYGGRILFDREGYLYFTLGERNQRDHAQDLTRPNGKIHRLHDDGRIPADNPFAAQAGAYGSIWSYGHRNPQGLALDPVTGAIYALEHGPRGGDELNLIAKGKNYGWPVITYGMEYSGKVITPLTEKEGMEQPVTYWTPSLGVCGMNFYTGDLFPKWKNQLFFASLSAEEVRRMQVSGAKLVQEEMLIKKLGRVRHVITGSDGALYVLLPNRIVRLTPSVAKS
jgi:glucose/arabinose dehydrogenase